jgi:SAM-dependent methyltransferase
MKCPVCDAPMTLVGHAAYYDLSSQFRTPVYSCASCDVLCRDIDQRRLVSHYYAASYVQEKNEGLLRRGRIRFFRWILSLIEGHRPQVGAGVLGRPVLLDFGSAYGHFLSLARERGYDAVGIELNDDLVKACREKGLVVYRRLDEFSRSADVVAAIDSLYCVPDPRELLAGIRRKLRPGGVFLVRVTNRNLHARLRGRLGRRGDFSAIGDATVSYSVKAVRRLLDSSGFRVEKVIPDCGRGKQLGIRKRWLYLLSYVLTLGILKKVILTPGVIMIARPRPDPSRTT